MTEQPPPIPATPPTRPGPVVLQRRLVWPTAIGIVGIIWAAFGIISQVWGLVSSVFFDLLGSVSAFMPPMDFTRLKTLTIAMNAGALPFSILLLTASILLLQRRRSAITALRWWAIGAIPLALAQVAGTLLFQHAQFQTIAALNSAQGGGSAVQMLATPLMVFTGLWTLAIGAGPPIFVLFWLRRPVIRDQIPRWFT